MIGLERGIFAKFGIDLEYKLVPEGTGRFYLYITSLLSFHFNLIGAMIDLLEKGQCDVALTVTDGFLASRGRGRQVELIGTYVEVIAYSWS